MPASGATEPPTIIPEPMATYYTKSEARSAAINAKQQFKRQGKLTTRILREEANAASKYDIFDIFLSHASKDADLILGVKALLESQGYKVYVDWVDDAQLDRAKVTTDTAELLRTRMRQSKSLIWVATESASVSKWMPWELGYFDGYKPKQVAILPLVDSAYDTFKGQEYLALYPIVGKNQYRNGGSDVFVEGGGEWATLRNFATGTPNFARY